MEIFNSFPFNEDFKDETSIALGYFDGMHIAHKQIINYAISSQYKSVVITFDKHPFEVINHLQPPKKLISLEEKIDLLKNMGVDYLYILPFNDQVMNLSPEDFIKEIIVKLNAKKVSVGFNYTFGKGGKGDVKLLEEFGEKYGFQVNEVKEIKIKESKVSSTIIREFVNNGDIENANLFLGREFSLHGKVIEGRKVGRTINIPTANFFPDKTFALPNKGVYITRTKIEDKFYFGITNIGKNPTFEEDLSLRIETNLFDFSEDIYGKEIEVFFIKKLRGEKPFPSVEDLINQINSDKLEAKQYIKDNNL